METGLYSDSDKARRIKHELIKFVTSTMSHSEKSQIMMTSISLSVLDSNKNIPNSEREVL